MKVKGNGSIQQVRNSKGEPVKNSWQLVLSLGYDSLTGKRRRITRPFRGSKREAQKRLNSFRQEIEMGLIPDADGVLFCAYAKQWLNSREASGAFAAATILRNEQLLAHLLRHLKVVRVTDIDASTVRNLYVALARDGVGQYSIAKAAIILNQILKQATNDGILLYNPCDRVDRPKQPPSSVGTSLDRRGVARLTEALAEIESREYPLAQAQQQQHTSDMAHITAIRLILATGIRRGECLGLSWSDVDFRNSEITIRHTLCRTSGKLKVPKSDKSNRVIALDSAALSDLQRWKQQQAEYLLSIGIKQDSDCAVITTGAGTRMIGTNLARWWRTFKKQHNFSENLRIHDLRHSHISLLVSSGVNMKAISSRAGHASVAFTMDRYAHAMKEDDEKAAAIMGEIMTQSTLRDEQDDEPLQECAFE